MGSLVFAILSWGIMHWFLFETAFARLEQPCLQTLVLVQTSAHYVRILLLFPASQQKWIKLVADSECSSCVPVVRFAVL